MIFELSFKIIWKVIVDDFFFVKFREWNNEYGEVIWEEVGVFKEILCLLLVRRKYVLVLWEKLFLNINYVLVLLKYKNIFWVECLGCLFYYK